MLAPLVLLHGLFSVELLVANVALKWAIVAMRPFVDPEISLLSVLLATDFAGKRLLSRVSDQMPFHGCHADEPFATNCTDWQDFGGTFSHTCFLKILH